MNTNPDPGGADDDWCGESFFTMSERLVNFENRKLINGGTGQWGEITVDGAKLRFTVTGEDPQLVETFFRELKAYAIIELPLPATDHFDRKVTATSDQAAKADQAATTAFNELRIDVEILDLDDKPILAEFHMEFDPPVYSMPRHTWSYRGRQTKVEILRQARLVG